MMTARPPKTKAQGDYVMFWDSEETKKGRNYGELRSAKQGDLNTLRNRKFKVAGSLTSVTRSAAFRDYNFRNVRYRIVDLPGLSDTNRTDAEIESELHSFATFAPHGVSAFIFVLPKGRITHEHEVVLLRANELFGADISEHSLIAITHATAGKHGARKSLMTRDMLMEEVDALPPEHFLRRLVAKCGYRLVGVENKVETHRARSQLLLNQAVLDVVAANDGERFDVSHLIRNGGDNRGAAQRGSTRSPRVAPSPSRGGAGAGGGSGGGECAQVVTTDGSGRVKIELQCKPGSRIPWLIADLLQQAGACSTED